MNNYACKSFEECMWKKRHIIAGNTNLDIDSDWAWVKNIWG